MNGTEIFDAVVAVPAAWWGWLTSLKDGDQINFWIAFFAGCSLLGGIIFFFINRKNKKIKDESKVVVNIVQPEDKNISDLATKIYDDLKDTKNELEDAQQQLLSREQ